MFIYFIFSSINRANSEVRFDAAMQKLMTCSSIIVTKQFITSARLEHGGFLKNRGLSAEVVKPARVLDELLSCGLLIKCDLVQGTRCGSYYRQFPSVIAQDPSMSTALQVRLIIFVLNAFDTIIKYDAFHSSALVSTSIDTSSISSTRHSRKS